MLLYCKLCICLGLFLWILYLRFGLKGVRISMPILDFLYLIGFVALPVLIGFAGGIVTAKAIPGWYRELNKPSWNPPSKVFMPVWTVLYIMMGTASWLIWRVIGFQENWVAIYAAQLFLNGIWSWVFFGWKRLELAFADIVMLWLAIFACTVIFWNVSLWAGGFMLPYLAWVTFAATLNYKIWTLNRKVSRL